MKKQKIDPKNAQEHLAKASSNDLAISTKHCIEICNSLRYKTTAHAKQILEEVIALKKPIAFKRFKHNVGHKAGMAAGRFPQKAAQAILKLIQSVETNAQFKGLNTSTLKITKILANRASIPMTGKRKRTSTKRSSLEIEVKEIKRKKEPQKKIKQEAKSETDQPVEKEVNTIQKEETKTEETQVEQKPAVEPVKEEETQPTPETKSEAEQ